MGSKHFDVIMVGAGAASSHLYAAFRREAAFKKLRIALIDPDPKNTNDRTWCFWEKGQGLWDHLVSHSWSKGLFVNAQEERLLELNPYKYKMLRGIDLYDHMRALIDADSNTERIHERVVKVKSGEPCSVSTNQNEYTADFVFDSRVDEKFNSGQDKYTRLLQHFKGWEVKTTNPVFDQQRFTMMDFRLVYPGTTSFTYVLPFAPDRALVEFTFFSPAVVEDKEYDAYLKKYIEEVLGVKEYEVKDSEKGVIPMSDFPFHHADRDHVMKIGTAGSWVKGSTGYSFKNGERLSKRIVSNIKAGYPPSKGLHNKRFRLYDKLFLDVLNRQNANGPKIFSDMYLKNDVDDILAFLDEETSLATDFSIINSFEKGPFTRSLLRNVIG